MDMALANLFKHKIRFERYDSYYGRDVYYSGKIENLESLGARSIYDICFKHLQPFLNYVLSTIIHECPDTIGHTEINTKVIQARSGSEEQDLIGFITYDPRNNIHLFSEHHGLCVNGFSYEKFQEDKPFYIIVEANAFVINSVNYTQRRVVIGLSRKIEEEYTPPSETYRQDCCVICLEAKPNILYLDCKHIAICDSCEQMKSETSLHSTCDLCRATIYRRRRI